MLQPKWPELECGNNKGRNTVFIAVGPLGDITSVSKTRHDNESIEINDDSEWGQILNTSNSNDYKFIYETLEHHPQPSKYHKWDGSSWVLSQALLKDAREDMWEGLKTYRQERQYLGVKINTAQGYKWVHSDETSRILHVGLVCSAIFHILHTFLGVTSLPQFPANQYWKTMEVDEQQLSF